MSYLYLAAAIILEVIATTLLKVSNCFSKLGIGLISLICYGICFYVFSLALKEIDLSIAYAVWSGVGIIATSIIGVLIWNESISLFQAFGIFLIIVGIVIVNLAK